MCHRWKRPFLSPICHGVFKSSTLHFSSKMGKQSAISPITSSSPRRRGRNSAWRDPSVWGAMDLPEHSLVWMSICFNSCTKNKKEKKLEKEPPKWCWRCCQLTLGLLLRCECVPDQVALSPALTPCHWQPFLLFLLDVWLSRTGPQHSPLQYVSAQRICWKSIHSLGAMVTDINSGHISSLSDGVIFISLYINSFIIVCQHCLAS